MSKESVDDLQLVQQGNGRVVFALIVMLAGEWVMATYLLALASCTCFTLFFFLPESPIWLRRQGEWEKAEQAEILICKFKGIDPDQR